MKYVLKKKPSICGEPQSSLHKIADTEKNLEQFVAFGVGLDIHKNSIATCVSGQLSSGEILEYKEHTFRNNYPGVNELCGFLRKFIAKATVLMECTGVYHVAVYQTLTERFTSRNRCIIAMNPLLVHRKIADLGTKTDRADARTLSILALYGKLLRPSYVGTSEFFATRDLMRSYHKAQSRCTQFKNRLHRNLHLANQKFSFDFSTNWGITFLEHYISQDWSLGECYEDLLKNLEAEGKGKVLKKQAEEVAINASVTLTSLQRTLIQMDLIQLLQNQQACSLYIQQAEQEIIRNPELSQQYQRLSIIPGFSSITVLTVLTEIGDYTRFKNYSAFSKFCGVVPTIEDSGEHKSRGHVNRFTNKHLRKVLTQAAGVVIGRPNRQTDIGAYAFKQFKLRRLPFKKAMMKVAWKYSRIIYSVLSENREYNPCCESIQRKRSQLARKMAKKGSILESCRTRAVRQDISNILVKYSELLNRTSRYHLVNGFHRLIRKSQYLDGQTEVEN